MCEREKGNEMEIDKQGCHLALKISIIWPFLNNLLEMKCFGHLANSILLGLFWLNFNKIPKFIRYNLAKNGLFETA